MSACLFCKIANGVIPSNKVYEDDRLIVFHDISPMAPVHVLIVPKVHIPSLNEVQAQDGTLMAHIMSIAAKVADTLGVSGTGYRVVNNCGEDGGQTVAHLHFHLLGGRSLQWPPG